MLFGRNTLGGAPSTSSPAAESRRARSSPSSRLGSFGRQRYRTPGRRGGPSVRLPGLAHPGPGGRLPGLHAPRDSRGDSPSWAPAPATSTPRCRTSTAATGSSRPDRSRRESSVAIAAANFTAGDFYAPELHLAIVNARYRLADHVTVDGNTFVRDLSVEQFNVNAAAENSRLLNHTRSVGGRDAGELRPAPARASTTSSSRAPSSRATTSPAAPSRRSQESRSLEASLADTQDAAGVYVQNSLAVARGFAGPRSSVVLTAAGRWDLLRHRIDDRLGGPSGGTHTFQRINPRAGVNVNLSEHVGAFVSYGEGFRAPAFLELTCAGPGAVCPGLQVGVAPDPPLQAVKARTYEVGVYARPVDLAGPQRHRVPERRAGRHLRRRAHRHHRRVLPEHREPRGARASRRAHAVRVGRALDLYLNYAYTEATFEDRIVDLATPLPPGSQTVEARAVVRPRAAASRQRRS